MTISTSSNKTIVLGDGSTTQFAFGFIGVAAAYITVIYTDASGNETVLVQGSGATQYQIVLNAAVQGAIWGEGGTVTYDPSGTPIAVGTSLTIFRTLPLTQAISLQNQISLAALGNGAETGLDTGTMQLQQVFEQIGRAIVAPISDPTAPLPLPTIQQRANKGAVFDSSGNLTAGVTPSSGVISTAMQPVVDAATLAAGRTAFGLGAMAVENIGGGLADDGAGNARVNFPISQVSTSHNVTTADYLKSFITTGPINFVYPRANTLFNGFGHWIYNTAGGAITLQIDSHDNFQGYSSGQAIEIPPNACAFVSTDGGTNGKWLVDWAMAGGPVVSGGSFAGLTLTNTTNGAPNTNIDCSIGEFVLPSANNGTVRFTGGGFTLNATTNGANGLDTGALTTSTWYYIWAISNGASLAGLLSLSATAPTLPTGYVFAKRIGAVLTDSSAHFYRFLQKGSRTKYVVTPATNTAAPRAIINQAGAIGNPSTPTYVAYSVAGFVPPTASIIHLQMMANSGAASSICMVSANNNSGAYTSTTNMPPITSVFDATSSQQLLQSISASLMLESSSIYVIYNGSGNLTLAADGWTDNL